MAYNGPERRIHKVFVTRNTEYHIRRNVCVGVRDRSSGRWIKQHLAVSKKLCGALRIGDGGVRPNLGTPEPGESLYFHGDETDVVTSALEEIHRPPKSIVQTYPLAP